jgi:hypothetical protein
LRLIDELFADACRDDIASVVAESVGGAHAENQGLFVFMHLAEHVSWCDEVGVVVWNSLQTSDMSDRADGRAAKFADALGEVLGHCEDLAALIVEHEMIVAEIRPAHVRVEVLGLQIRREDFGSESIQGGGYVLDGARLDIGCGGSRALRRAMSSLLLDMGIPFVLVEMSIGSFVRVDNAPRRHGTTGKPHKGAALYDTLPVRRLAANGKTGCSPCRDGFEAARYLWMSDTTTEPSPTAEATRLTEPQRTSPTA